MNLARNTARKMSDGYQVGLPSLKLNNVGNISSKCGSFEKVAGEALERIGRDTDIDPSRSHLNVIMGSRAQTN